MRACSGSASELALRPGWMIVVAIRHRAKEVYSSENSDVDPWGVAVDWGID